MDIYQEKIAEVRELRKTEEGETAHEALEETDGAID